MNLINKNKQKQSTHSLLSATQPKKSILEIRPEEKNKLNTVVKQKSKIKIYIEGDKYFIEHSTAYTLGLINTRAVMLNKPKLIELPDSMHIKLKNHNDIEIEYVKIDKKQKIMVYVDNSSYCIDNSAAYALGLLSIEQFYSSENQYYYINKDFLDSLMKQFEVEFYSLNLHNEGIKKR